MTVQCPAGSTWALFNRRSHAATPCFVFRLLSKGLQQHFVWNFFVRFQPFDNLFRFEQSQKGKGRAHRTILK